MGKQRESKLSTQIQTALRTRGVFVFKVHGSEYMQVGLPDLICCVRGVFVGLEVKMPESRGEVSKIQTHRHAEIRAAGGEAHVVCSVREALSIVDRVEAAVDRIS